MYRIILAGVGITQLSQFSLMIIVNGRLSSAAISCQLSAVLSCLKLSLAVSCHQLSQFSDDNCEQQSVLSCHLFGCQLSSLMKSAVITYKVSCLHIYS